MSFLNGVHSTDQCDDLSYKSHVSLMVATHSCMAHLMEKCDGTCFTLMEDADASENVETD